VIVEPIGRAPAAASAPVDAAVVVSADFLTSDIVLLVVLAVVALIAAGIIAFVWRAIVRRQHRLVSESSSALQRLDDVNSISETLVLAHPTIRLTFGTAVNSKSRFDRFDLRAHMEASILENEAWFEQELISRNTAVTNFEKYRLDVEAISYELLGKSVGRGFAPAKFTHIENKLFQRRTLPYPEPKARITAAVSYTSPQGRNSYSQELKWDYDMLEEGMRTAQANRARLTTTEALHKRERRLMSAGLRTEILRRDGFRCRMCGAAASAETTLHVDHIKPVSLDGRTVPENLQTLCQSCNLGKGNRFVG